jgi:hypothetical protein
VTSGQSIAHPASLLELLLHHRRSGISPSADMFKKRGISNKGALRSLKNAGNNSDEEDVGFD